MMIQMFRYGWVFSGLSVAYMILHAFNLYVYADELAKVYVLH